jgi:hypothetical protein
MDKQLTLLQAPTPWKLDERTRQVGLRGVAEARAALRAGRHADEHPDHQRSAA